MAAGYDQLTGAVAAPSAESRALVAPANSSFRMLCCCGAAAEQATSASPPALHLSLPGAARTRSSSPGPRCSDADLALGMRAHRHDSVFTMRQNDLICSLVLTPAKELPVAPNSGSSTVACRG